MEEVIKRKERSLVEKTIKRLNKESCWCGSAEGKLAKIATAHGFDKGIYRIIKSVWDFITEEELKSLLYFNEAPNDSPCVIEIWVWDSQNPWAREPKERYKLFYNEPNQRISDELQKIIR